jgi:hypothetical protein
MARTRKEDKYRWYEEAEALYLQSGKLSEVSEKVGCPLKVLEGWCREYNWEVRRQGYLGSPRGAAEVIRGMMQSKVSALGASGELTVARVEELGKISKALGQMDQEGLASAGRMEVIREFSKWVRGRCKGEEDYAVVSHYLQSYLQEEVFR